MFWQNLFKTNKNNVKPIYSVTYFKTNPSWSLNINFKKLEDIYKTNSTIFRCIHLVSECANSMKINCNNEKVHKYLNNHLEEIIINLLLYGNCFLHKDLFILPIENLSILTNNNTKTPFAYKNANMTYIFENILHLKYCNNPSNLFSISPVQVSVKWVDICTHIQNYINLIMEHGGKPAGILSHNNFSNDREKELLKDQFFTLYNQLQHNNQALISEGQISWQPIGTDPDKLDLINHWNNGVKEIANCFGVPVILLGVKDFATFANYSHARKHLWEDLVIPFLVNLLNKIEVFFNCEIHLNTSNVEILNDKIWTHNLLTVNEKRKLLGYGPIVGGDVLEPERKSNG